MKYVFFKKDSSNPEDIAKFEQALAIRTAVFIDEQKFTIELDDTDDIAVHMLVYDGDTPIATARAFVDNGNPPYRWTIGRVCVGTKARGTGLGRVIMEQLEKHIVDSYGATEFVLSAQCRVEDFYKKLGYTSYGEAYMDEHCPHISMEKLL